MGWWSFYFLLKLLGHAEGALAFQWLPNLILALFVLLPLQGARRLLQQLIAIAAAVALLYAEARLPPITRLVSEFHILADFDLRYLWELAGRFVGLQDIALLIGLAAGYWLLAAKLRMGAFALLGILMVPLAPLLLGLLQPGTVAPGAGVAGDTVSAQIEAADSRPPELQLEAFHDAESRRAVRFSPPAIDGPGFDIVFIHVCSVAWDDLDLFGLADHRLLTRRDIAFQNFNTATTYSGPSAIRLARATCGQQPHEALYSPAEPECLLFEQLAAQGYQPQLMTNWTDRRGMHDFVPNLRKLGGLNARQRNVDDAPVAMRSYDGELIYSDDALLDAWRADRRDNPEQPTALYYNTTSLHDGNRLVEKPRASSTDTYAERTRRLFDELNAFIDALETADRRTVVVLVPEHGGAMRGDALQIPGMREIPTPAITIAPVGVFLAGGERAHDAQRIVTPTSYFALGTLLARFLAEDPFAADAPALRDYLIDLPATRPVSVSDGEAVMRSGGRFMRRDVNAIWRPLETGLGRAETLLTRPPVPLQPGAAITIPDRD